MYIERSLAIARMLGWGEPALTDREIKALLEEIPAADVAPVVRGRWEKEGACGKFDKMCCTACNCLLLVNWFDRSMVYRFCPNCGARMDGGGDAVESV